MRSMLIALACGGSPDCDWWDPTSWPGCVTYWLCTTITDLVTDIFEFLYVAIGEMVAAAVGLIIEAIGTLWIKVPTTTPTENEPTVEFMRGQTLWLVAVVTVMSIIIAGIRMAWQARGEPARELVKSLFLLVLVSASGLGFATLLTEASDALAETFINEAVQRSGKSFGDNIADLVAGPLAAGGGVGVVPLILVLGFTAVFVSIMQIILMIVRNAMLVLLVGVLPIAAAATNTEMGKAWFRKCCGWLVAFIAYKPFAALIYATAIMLGGSQGDLMKVMTGVVMMVLSVIALPALLRLVSPPGGG